jgi:single-strand DNA-binding protein
MINRVVLVGRITRDPETQTTNTGIPYVRFSLACNRPFKDQNGERQADFINCIAWRNQAEFLKNFVRKGNQLAVEGRIQTNNYTDANGNNRQAFDVLVESVSNLEPASKNDGYQPQPPFGNGFQPVSHNSFNQGTQTQSVEFEVSEDDLPF